MAPKREIERLCAPEGEDIGLRDAGLDERRDLELSRVALVLPLDMPSARLVMADPDDGRPVI